MLFPMLHSTLAKTIILLAVTCTDLRLNVQDFGAKGDEVTDCTVAFQRAYIAARNLTDIDRKIQATVYIPSAKKAYLIQRPIVVEDSFVRFQGDGMGSRVLNTGFGPAFLIGLRTAERTSTRVAALDPRYYPSRTIVGLSGQGVRLNKDSSIGFYGTPFDLGPRKQDGGFTRWQGNKQLTVELIFESKEQTWRQHGILSLGGLNTPPTIYLGKGGVENQFDFAYTDLEGRTVRFDFKGIPGINRFVIQLNLEGGTGTIFHNDEKKEIVIPQSAGLAGNDRSTFLIGADGNTSDGRISLASPGRTMPDFVLYGLKISDRIRYPSHSIPSYADIGGFDGSCVAQLYGSTTGRLVSAFSGTNQYRIFYGYHVQVDQMSLLGGQQGNTLEDFQVVNANSTSATIQTFGLLDFKMRGMWISGGSQGLSTFPATATYFINLEDCDIQAPDYSIVTSWAIVRARDIRFRNVGRGAISAEASDFRLNQSVVTFTSPYTDTIYSGLGGLYGGRHRITDLLIDMEGPSCRLAPFYIEQSPGIRSSLYLEDIYLGTAAVGKPLVIKKTIPGPDPLVIGIEDVDGQYQSMVQERLP